MRSFSLKTWLTRMTCPNKALPTEEYGWGLIVHKNAWSPPEFSPRTGRSVGMESGLGCPSTVFFELLSGVSVVFLIPCVTVSWKLYMRHAYDVIRCFTDQYDFLMPSYPAKIKQLHFFCGRKKVIFDKVETSIVLLKLKCSIPGAQILKTYDGLIPPRQFSTLNIRIMVRCYRKTSIKLNIKLLNEICATSYINESNKYKRHKQIFKKNLPFPIDSMNW